MAEMLKFYKGLVGSLPTTGTNGALYITTDEGGIYLGTGTGMKRLGDFVQVADVASLPEKAHESCLYYCVAENILAKWNGTEWTQINKQKTLAELGGVAQAAYDEKVAALEKADSDNADAISGVDTRLQAAEEKLKSVATTEGLGELTDRVTAAEEDIVELQGKAHEHSFVEAELNKIADGDVAKWNAAEGNAKTYADGLNTAMNTRVEALEAIDHEHANKALLDTYTQTEADLADAVAKKHAHTFVESELNKIVAGDVAKWNGVAADHLTSADKTLIEDAIGDVNTALENYKTSNNEALAGVKATADAAAVKTEVETALAGKVDKVEGKSLLADSEIARLLTLANYDDTQVKADIAKKADAETMTTELAKKVDKVEGYSLVSDTEIARLANVDNYNDEAVRGLIGANADAIEALSGYVGTIPNNYTETNVIAYINKKAEETLSAAQGGSSETAASVKQQLDNYKSENDTRVAGIEGDIADLEAASETHALKTEVEAVDAKFADYNTTAIQKGIDDAQDARIKAIEDTYLVAEDIADFETKENVKKVADDLAAYVESNDAAVADRYTKAEADGKFALIADAYDDEEVRGLIADNAEAIATETERATGIEGGLRTDVDAIKADYLKAADKTELEGKITANANAITTLTNGIDPDKIDGLTDLVEWANEHAPEVESIKEDIEANAKAIADHEALAAQTYETKADATSKKTEIDGRLDALEGKVDVAKVSTAIADAVKVETDRATGIEEGLANRIKDLEDNKAGYATTGEVATAKQEAIDAAANDAAAKYEEIGVAKGLVDALAEGAVADNTAAIATKANSADVYLKTETYTQAEVDALIEAAHTWGEF